MLVACQHKILKPLAEPDAAHQLTPGASTPSGLQHPRTNTRAGTRELFVDALPGFPDGLSRASDGGFWLTLAAPCEGVLQHLRFAAVRWALPWLPPSLHPQMKSWGFVVKLSSEGKVLFTLQDPDGSHVAQVASALERDGRLWLGNVALDYIAYLDL